MSENATMGNILSDFLTNRALFFDQFDLAANNLVEMARLLQTVIETDDRSDLEAMYKQINKKENFGDDITHKINLYLHKIIFPPLNKPDIHALASALDDVADAIHEAGGRIYLYAIEEFSPAIKQIAIIILKASLEVEKAIKSLRAAKKTGELPMICRHINNYQVMAEKVYYHALADLFSDEKNAIKVIKYREILLSLETSVNKCKGVTDVLNTILING